MPKKKNVGSTNDFIMASRKALSSLSGQKLKVMDTYIGAGIEMPLAMQYFLDVRAWPLGLIVQLIGDRGSRKTTFLLCIGSWAADLGGMIDFTLTEGKYSDVLANSILGYDDEIVDEEGNPAPSPISVRISSNMGEWQTAINNRVSTLNTMMEKGWEDPDTGITVPPGMYSPIVFGVDSIVAQLTESQATSIEKQGGSDRGFATHVKAISEWLSYIQTAITCKPYSLVLINHCTIDKPTPYLVEIKEKGGRKLSYESSLIIFMSKASSTILTCNNENYAPEMVLTDVTFKLTKSSLGNDTRKITVPILDMHEIVGPGDVRQRTHFLWGAALVNILMSRMYSDANFIQLSTAEKTASLTKRYRDAFTDVVPIKRLPGNKYNCEKYSDEVLTAEQLGCFLEQDSDFRRVFYEQFGIKMYDIWTPGTNYVDFIKEVKEKSYKERIKIPELTKGFGDE